MNISLLEFLYILNDTLDTAFQTLLDLPLWFYILAFFASVAFKCVCEYYDSKK